MTTTRTTLHHADRIEEVPLGGVVEGLLLGGDHDLVEAAEWFLTPLEDDSLPLLYED